MSTNVPIYKSFSIFFALPKLRWSPERSRTDLTIVHTCYDNLIKSVDDIRSHLIVMTQNNGRACILQPAYVNMSTYSEVCNCSISRGIEFVNLLLNPESFIWGFVPLHGTVKFSSEIAISLNFTAEHTENAEAPENLSNGWSSLKTLRTRRSPR